MTEEKSNKKKEEIKKQIDDKKVDEYSEMLKKVCKASKTSSRQAIVSLPVSSVFHAIVNLPSYTKKDEIGKMVKTEVKKFIPFPLEQMSLDYQIINNKKGKDKEKDKQEKKEIKVLVNAVPNQLIVFYSKIFQKAGLSLVALEPESTALARSLVGIDTAVNMIIDIGEERTNFFIIDQSIPITHQSINFGGNKINKIIETSLGINKELVSRIKFDLFNYYINSKDINKTDFIQLFNMVVDPIIKEIHLSLELFYTQLGDKEKRPEKIILTGGSSFLPYLSDFISEEFNIKSYIGDPWARVVYQQTLKPLLQEIAPRMSVSIGLALRNMV